MCVSHVTLAFTRLYIPNGPLKSAKNTTALPHTRHPAGALHLDAGPGPHIARLTRSCLDPSSPKRYVTQVHLAPPRTRPSRKSCATALSCVEPRRSEKASVKNKSNRWCHLFAKSIYAYTRIASTASCLSPPKSGSQVGPESMEENRLSV